MLERKQIKDSHGNNHVVECGECGGHFIVSGFLNKKNPRECPHCGGTSYSWRDICLALESVFN